MALQQWTARWILLNERLRPDELNGEYFMSEFAERYQALFLSRSSCHGRYDDRVKGHGESDAHRAVIPVSADTVLPSSEFLGRREYFVCEHRPILGAWRVKSFSHCQYYAEGFLQRC